MAKKKLNTGEKVASLNIRIPEKLRDAIPGAAEKAGLNQSQYVRQILENAIHDNPLVLRRRIEKLEGQLQTIKDAVRSI